eukprot:354806-Chlamydomonas_euryale.AAC.2
MKGTRFSISWQGTGDQSGSAPEAMAGGDGQKRWPEAMLRDDAQRRCPEAMPGGNAQRRCPEATPRQGSEAMPGGTTAFGIHLPPSSALGNTSALLRALTFPGAPAARRLLRAELRVANIVSQLTGMLAPCSNTPTTNSTSNTNINTTGNTTGNSTGNSDSDSNSRVCAAGVALGGGGGNAAACCGTPAASVLRAATDAAVDALALTVVRAATSPSGKELASRGLSILTWVAMLPPGAEPPPLDLSDPGVATAVAAAAAAADLARIATPGGTASDSAPPPPPPLPHPIAANGELLAAAGTALAAMGQMLDHFPGPYGIVTAAFVGQVGCPRLMRQLAALAHSALLPRPVPPLPPVPPSLPPGPPPPMQSPPNAMPAAMGSGNSSSTPPGLAGGGRALLAANAAVSETAAAPALAQAAAGDDAHQVLLSSFQNATALLLLLAWVEGTVLPGPLLLMRSAAGDLSGWFGAPDEGTGESAAPTPVAVTPSGSGGGSDGCAVCSNGSWPAENAGLLAGVAVAIFLLGGLVGAAALFAAQAAWARRHSGRQEDVGATVAVAQKQSVVQRAFGCGGAACTRSDMAGAQGGAAGTGGDAEGAAAGMKGSCAPLAACMQFAWTCPRKGLGTTAAEGNGKCNDGTPSFMFDQTPSVGAAAAAAAAPRNRWEQKAQHSAHGSSNSSLPAAPPGSPGVGSAASANASRVLEVATAMHNGGGVAWTDNRTFARGSHGGSNDGDGDDGGGVCTKENGRPVMAPGRRGHVGLGGPSTPTILQALVRTMLQPSLLARSRGVGPPAPSAGDAEP